MPLGPNWRKATRSGPSGSCVEARQAAPGEPVEVRDSKNKNGPALVFRPDEWAAFVGGAADGEFDLS
jgi:hypothetical protein